MTDQTAEYLRRNMLVAKCVGAEALARSITMRAAGWSRQPHWLALGLAEMQLRIEALVPELAAHRDELKGQVEGLSTNAEEKP